MTRLAEVKAERDRIDHERWATQLALTCVVRHELCDYSEIVQEHNGTSRWKIAAYRLTAAHGGVLILEYRADGQRPSVTAVYFDEWATQWRGRMGDPYALPFILAAEHVSNARNRLLAVTAK